MVFGKGAGRSDELSGADESVEFVEAFVGADLVKTFADFVADQLAAGDECALHGGEIDHGVA